MKRIKNQKGFTLIELLAVIIILAVIMTVAIPNIIGTLDKNKKDSFIKDAKRAVTSCQYTIKSEKKYEYPDETTAVIFPINKIKNLKLNVSSFDTYYSEDESFVAITKDLVTDEDGITNYEYMYYVHLVSCTDEKCENLEDNSSLKNRGINIVDAGALDNSSRYDLVVKGNEVKLGYLKDLTFTELKSALTQARIDNADNDINIANNNVEYATVTDIVIY